MTVIWNNESAFWDTAASGGPPCNFAANCQINEEYTIVPPNGISLAIVTDGMGVNCYEKVGITHEFVVPYALKDSISFWLYGRSAGKIYVTLLSASGSATYEMTETFLGWERVLIRRSSFAIIDAFDWSHLIAITIQFDTQADIRYFGLLETNLEVENPFGDWYAALWKALVDKVVEIPEFGTTKVFYGEKYPPDTFPSAFVCPGVMESIPATMRESLWQPMFEIGVVVEDADAKQGFITAYGLVGKIIDALEADRSLGDTIHNLECSTVIPYWRGLGHGMENHWLGIVVKCERKR